MLTLCLEVLLKTESMFSPTWIPFTNHVTWIIHFWDTSMCVRKHCQSSSVGARAPTCSFGLFTDHSKWLWGPTVSIHISPPSDLSMTHTRTQAPSRSLQGFVQATLPLKQLLCDCEHRLCLDRVQWNPQGWILLRDSSLAHLTPKTSLRKWPKISHFFLPESMMCISMWFSLCREHTRSAYFYLRRMTWLDRLIWMYDTDAVVTTTEEVTIVHSSVWQCECMCVCACVCACVRVPKIFFPDKAA
jgi:hypothetical protein